jgi:hypothetical protein
VYERAERFVEEMMNYRLRLVIRVVYFTWLFVLLGVHRLTFWSAFLAGLLYVAVGMNSPLYSEEEKSRVRRTFSWVRASDTPAKARRARIALVTIGVLFVTVLALQFTPFALLPRGKTDDLARFVIAYALTGLAFDWWTLRSGEVDARRSATD